MTKGYKGFQGVTGEREGLKWICQKKKKKKKSKFLFLRMLEKDDDVFNYARVAGKYAVFVATLFLPIGRETGRKSTQ